MIHYDEQNDITGLPQTYKNIIIKPLLLSDYKYYRTINTHLSICKDYIPNRDIIKMSMLKFITYVYSVEMNEAKEEKINIIGDILALFKHVFQLSTGNIDDIDIVFEHRNPEDRDIISYQDINLKLKMFLLIKSGEENLLYTEKDFEEIREIILRQNGISLDYVNQFNPQLEESLLFVNKNSNYADFEEQIFSFGAYMRLEPKYVCDNFTFYQFKKYIQRINLFTEYTMLKPLEASGQVKLKSGEISHWLSHVKEKGRYDDILISKDVFVKESDIFKASQQNENVKENKYG